jgi:hypothetical protein
MEESIKLTVNDTVRAIERVIKQVKEWNDRSGPQEQQYINKRETALVITKLEEAQMWAYRMVKPQPGENSK